VISIPAAILTVAFERPETACTEVSRRAGLTVGVKIPDRCGIERKIVISDLVETSAEIAIKPFIRMHGDQEGYVGHCHVALCGGRIKGLHERAVNVQLSA